MLHDAIDPSSGCSLKDRAERQMTVLINAAITQNGRDGLCRIRNVSATGLNLETSLPLEIGAPATLTMHSGRTISCDIRWRTDKRYGASCAEDPTALVSEARLTAQDGPEPALPRFARSLPVQITVTGLVESCHLDSISTRDVLLTGVVSSREPSQLLSVIIPGLGTLPAVTRLSEEGNLFARFSTPIAFAALDAWLAGDHGQLRRPVATR